MIFRDPEGLNEELAACTTSLDSPGPSGRLQAKPHGFGGKWKSFSFVYTQIVKIDRRSTAVRMFHVIIRFM